MPVVPNEWRDAEAELILIGCAAAGEPAATKRLRMLTPEVLTDKRHRRIWAIIQTKLYRCNLAPVS